MLKESLLVLRHRRWLFLSVLVALLGLSTLAALLVQPTYRSSATLLLGEASVRGDLMGSAVPGFAEQRIQAINQRVLAFSNLLDIINAYNLYAEKRVKEPDDVIVKLMREDLVFSPKSVEIKDAAKDRPSESTIGFTISFAYKDPIVAQRVVDKLSSLYTQMNKEDRLRVVNETKAFFDSEAARVTKNVDESERQLREFRAQYAENLPEQIDENRRGGERSIEDLRDVDRQIQAATERRRYYESERAQQNAYKSIEVGGQKILSPTDQLVALQVQLAIISPTYGPKHPSVVELENKIKEVSKLVDGSSRTQGARQTRRPDNPAYIQADAMVRAADADLQALTVRRAELKTRLAAYEERERQARVIEAEYTNLQRNHQIALQNYTEIREKQSRADLGRILEVQGKGGYLSVLEPASLPSKPNMPIRLLMFGTGALLSVLGAIGMTYVAEQSRPRLYSSRQLRAITGMGPLAMIPFIEVHTDSPATWRKLAIWSLCGLLVVLASGLIGWDKLPIFGAPEPAESAGQLAR